MADYMTIGANPTGVKGIIAGRIMNMIHSRRYRSIIKRYISVNNGESILDIGCGGGTALSIFYAVCEATRICGADPSKEMVRLAGKVKRTGVEAGAIDIVQCAVEKLVYADRMFDVATAFDTVNFWLDMDAALCEIKRVLKRGGKFFIINAYPKEGTKWWDFVKFKNASAYLSALSTYFKTTGFYFFHNTLIIKAE